MSSIVGHALVGATIYLVANRIQDRAALRALPVFVLLAIAPDFDYFAIWLWGVFTKPRITHTATFCVVIACAAWYLTRRMHRSGGARLPLWALLASSLSHVLLDYWVGTNALALFWPFSDLRFEAPVGLLPSAARLRHGATYLWRNTLIELAVLLPLCMLIVALALGIPRRALAATAIFVTPVWLGALLWSMSLSR